MALSKVGKNQVDQSASLTVDSDFTVDTNTLYVDSTNNSVGIGTSTNTTHSLFIHDSDYQQLGLSGTRPTIFLKETDGNADENYQIRLDNGGLQFQTQNDAQTNAVSRLVLDSSGRVTMPYQPRFSGVGFAGAGSVNGGLTNFTWTTVHVNDGNHFNNTTGLFTCPVAGKYLVQFFFNRRATYTNWSGATIQKNNSSQLTGWFPLNTSDANYSYAPVGISLILSCSANDTIGLSYFNAYSLPSSDTTANSGSIMLIG